MTDTIDVPVQARILDLLHLRNMLQQAGWDAIASDLLGEVAARLDLPSADSVWSLVIDRAGRFRFTGTRVSAKPVETRQRRSGRVYTLALENKQVLTITGRLDSEEDLEPILQDLELLV